MSNQTNPDPDLFTTFERLEKCHRVEVTEDNLHILAKHFGWCVSYANDKAVLWRPGSSSGTVELGSWIDHKGSRWNPEPLTQGWSPEGTFTTTPAETTGGAR